MKKMTMLLLTSAIAVSLVACGESKPTEEEIIAALEEGTLTMEDAVEKEYVDQQWVDDYRAENSVPAADKAQSNMLADFETETMDGEVFTSDDLSPVTFIAFLNPNSQEAQTQYNVLVETYEDVVAGGSDVLVVNTTGEASELFDNAPFSIVSYNDSMKTGLGTLEEMVNEDGFTGSWNVNGSFMSAWYMTVDGDGFAETGTAMGEMVSEPAEDGAADMVAMG